MAHAVSATALPGTLELAPIPFSKIVPWAILFGLLASLAFFFVAAYPGSATLPAGSELHEWFHDGRHLLGFPCH